jgi:glycosyltransferase involved in cell wall biosynthesis
MRQVDVVLLTLNSEYMLNKCLTSIYDNVPVKNLIVIDGFSTDRTLSIIEKFNQKYGNISFFKMHGSRAKAREKGISQVTTDWFMFVDSDVVLCTDWFKKVKKELTSGVGAVWGLNIDVIPNVKDKRILLLQSLIARKGFNLRGGMHDTLILRKTVEDIRIPEELHAYEDAFIVDWIEKKGYKAVISDEVYCWHHKPPTNWSFQNAVNQAVVELKCGLIYSHMFEYMLFYPVFMIYWGLQVPLSGFGGYLTGQSHP